MTDPAGDVMFAGDIIVPGDLEGPVRIEALGNVYVYGDIRQSTIIATGSIYVSGQVTGSGLYAGHAGVMQHRLHSLACLLRTETDGLLEAARQLAKNVESRQQSVNYGLVVMLLLEDKYSHLGSLIRDLQAALSRMNGAFGSGTDQLWQMLEVFAHPGQFTGYITDSVLSRFSRLLLKLGEEIELLQEEHAVINLARSQDSRLESGGKLLVRDSC